MVTVAKLVITTDTDGLWAIQVRHDSWNGLRFESLEKAMPPLIFH